MKKMKKHFKRIALSLCAVALLLGSMLSAGADAPYKTFTFDGYGYMIQTQTAYLPYETITKFDDEALSGPSDLQVTDEGRIYVADTGNARVVVGDLEGNLLQTMGEGTLVSPRGIFVTENGHVYVADRDAEAVFEFDGDGQLLNRYGKPDSPLYGETLSFMPIKLVVNDAGIMYVICESNTNGIVEISPIDGGTFLGYFGTNMASSSPMIIIRRALATKAQRAKMVSNIPSTPDNLCIVQIQRLVQQIGELSGLIDLYLRLVGVQDVQPVLQIHVYGADHRTQAYALGSVVGASKHKQRLALKMVSNIPSTPDNLCIDSKGLIYTVTRGEEENTLKRLNIAGKNVIEPDTYDDIPAAVAAGNHDLIQRFYHLGDRPQDHDGPDDGNDPLFQPEVTHLPGSVGISLIILGQLGVIPGHLVVLFLEICPAHSHIGVIKHALRHCQRGEGIPAYGQYFGSTVHRGIYDQQVPVRFPAKDRAGRTL